MMNVRHPADPLPVSVLHPREGLRIGVVAPPVLSVPPIGYGGIERVVALLVEGLIERGHDVTLFAAPTSMTSAHLVSNVHTPRELGDPASLADELFHNAAAFREAGAFDIIHDHTATGAVFGAMFTDRAAVIHTLHGTWTPFSRRLFDLVGDRVHLVAISDAQMRSNSSVQYAGVVHNGVDLDAHPFVSDKEDFLIFLGRISAEKRPETAIDVARAAGLPLVMCIKATEPDERAYFEQMIVPRLGGDITVLEEPPHALKVDLLGRARALIFPIDWPEPFGLVMIEALACGTPVIARPLGAAPEIVRHGVTGFLCHTADEMVAAVGEVRSLNPSDCRTRAEQDFSGQAMVTRYEQIYRDVLSERSVCDDPRIRVNSLDFAERNRAALQVGN